jgi:hypothetical protein
MSITTHYFPLVIAIRLVVIHIFHGHYVVLSSKGILSYQIFSNGFISEKGAECTDTEGMVVSYAGIFF